MYCVYLAGPIKGLDYESASGWRLAVEMALGSSVKVLSPLRDKDYLKGKGKIEEAYPGYILGTPRAITVRDRNDIMNSDVVLMNLLGAKKISVGTMIEVGWADAFRKPIVLVMEPDNVHNHPILRCCAPFLTDSLQSGIVVVKSILGVS